MDRQQTLNHPLNTGLIALGLVVWLVGCTLPDSEATPPAPPAAATPLTASEIPTGAEPAFEISRVLAVVRAGASDPLPEIGPERQPLLDGQRVATDANGEALVQATLDGELCEVHLFQDGRLVKRACGRDDAQSGNVSCLEEGSAVFRDCSNHLVMTPGGEVRFEGTWAWVTYQPGTAWTSVVLLEGQATVWPVLDASTRQLGTPASLHAGEMWFSRPDGQPGTADGMQARAAYPVAEMARLAAPLGLGAWLDRGRDRAEADGFTTFPTAGAPIPTPVDLTLPTISDVRYPKELGYGIYCGGREAAEIQANVKDENGLAETPAVYYAYTDREREQIGSVFQSPLTGGVAKIQTDAKLALSGLNGESGYLMFYIVATDTAGNKAASPFTYIPLSNCDAINRVAVPTLRALPTSNYAPTQGGLGRASPPPAGLPVLRP